MSAPPDNFGNNEVSLNSPARSAAAVTPSDSTDLTNYTRAIYVGGSGNIVVDMAGDGSTLTFSNVAAGTILPLQVKRIRSTSTTATAIVALW